MNKSLLVFGSALAALSIRAAPPIDPPSGGSPAPASAGVAAASDARADRRYDEMLDRMRAAVEEIAALYGNPVFLQVFTNDPTRADELKQRIKTDRSSARLADELKDLGKKREALLDDIALKEREAARLSGRLIRQRAALEALASAVEAARKAVEDSSH